MKTKTKMLVVIGIIAALCAGYMIGILVNYPPVTKSDLAGTFGKAEKFHKTQMTTKDIQLRSELVKDTAKLRVLISDLTYFSVFTDRVGSSIDASLISFLAKGMGAAADETERFNALQDYVDFIRNNNNTLTTTISMLTGFYRNKSADASQDVEKTLKDLGAYLRNLNNKNSVFTNALESMDKFMSGRVALHAPDDETRQLKMIRDQLLIKGIQLGAMTGNLRIVNNLIGSAISKEMKSGEIQNIMVSSEVNIKSKADASKGKLLIYNGNTQKFSVIGKKDYAFDASKSASVSLVCQLDGGMADVAMPKFSMNEVIHFLSRNNLNNNTLGSNAVGSNAVGSNAVGSNAIGNNAVGSNAIGSNAVGSNAVGSNAVGSNAVGSNAIGNNAVGSNAVGSNAIGSNAVGSNAVGNNAVGSNAVGSNAIGSNAVGSNAIGSNAIGGNAIGGNTIGGNTIGGNTIGGNTIGGNTIGGNTIIGNSTLLNTITGN